MNQAGFNARDLAVGEVVCEKPLLIEAFDLFQINVHRALSQVAGGTFRSILVSDRRANAIGGG